MKTVFSAPGVPMSNSGLLALLETRQFYVVDLYSFGLATGGTLNYCAGDKDITWAGSTFTAGAQTGPYFDRTGNKAKVHLKIGLEVDSLTFDVLPGAATVSGAPFLTAARQGAFDAAEMILYRAFMPTYGDASNGLIIAFSGRVAEVDCGRSVATFTVNSHLELLNIQMPRNLYQPGCVNCLGDAACGVNLESFKTTGTVSSGSTSAAINAALTGSFQTGTFDLGKIKFTSGALNGKSYAVKSCAFGTPDVVSLVGFATVAPSAGDAFTLYYGCDKTPGLTSITITGLTSTGVSAIGDPSNYVSITAGMSVSGPGIQPGTVTTSDISSSNIALSLPVTQGVAIGDFTFTAPGGTIQNGCPKFSNQARFRGFPFIPQPATAA